MLTTDEIVLNFRFEDDQRFGSCTVSANKHYYRSHDYPKLLRDCTQAIVSISIVIDASTANISDFFICRAEEQIIRIREELTPMQEPCTNN